MAAADRRPHRSWITTAITTIMATSLASVAIIASLHLIAFVFAIGAEMRRSTVSLPLFSDFSVDLGFCKLLTSCLCAFMGPEGNGTAR